MMFKTDRNVFAFASAFALSAILPVTVFAALPSGAHTPSLPEARSMALAAEAEAVENHTQVVVTVVDSAANPILTERMAGAQLASMALARDKALSAVYYQRPSGAFEAALASGKMAVLALPGAMPAAGGIPIVDAHGTLVGAIGVSGGSNPQDEAAAEAGMRALQQGVQ